MSKYDFLVDLTENTSTGLILGKIKPGSTVLEFGCATGRMTRYMQQELDCRVYIVEYEQSAFDQAIQYAVDGLCDDILTYQWAERFADLQFDAIIFADVLEHLTSPEAVLVKAASLLKDSGSIHISLPNITHNDILLKAMDERFDYTSVGLLDDTHVHFWGLENIEALGDRTGLHLRRLEATYSGTGYTEQYGTGVAGKQLLKNLLADRPGGGEIYQFVLELGKQPGRCVRNLRAPTIEGHLYVDTGNDFNEGQCTAHRWDYVAPGTYHARLEFNSPNLKRLRIDPVEGQPCIVRNLQLTRGGKVLAAVLPDGTPLIAEGFLPGTDPFFLADTPGSGNVVFDADIVLMGEEHLHWLQRAYVEKLTKSTHLQQRLNTAAYEYSVLDSAKQAVEAEKQAVEAEKQAVETQLSDLTADHKKLQAQYRALTGRMNQLEVRFHEINGEREAFRLELGHYMNLADAKDRYAMEVEQKLNRYERMLFIRAYLLARKLAGKAKRLVKRLLGRA